MPTNHQNIQNRVFSLNWEWCYSHLEEFIVQLEYKEKKCEEMNKSKTYVYQMESSLSFSDNPKYKIVIKVYKRV